MFYMINDVKYHPSGSSNRRSPESASCRNLALIVGCLLIISPLMADSNASSFAKNFGTSSSLKSSIYAAGRNAEDNGRIQFGTVGTTTTLRLRVTDNEGRPLAGLTVLPLVTFEPDGVTQHMKILPQQKNTNPAGEIVFDVVPGNKPGRYEAILLQHTAGGDELSFTRFVFVVQDANWPTLLLLSLVGGLGIFLYGLKIVSDGLQGLAGRHVRAAMTDLAKHPMLGMVAGTIVTFFTQSSGATTALLMSFVRAHLLTFRNSVGIILGAAIGGTITVQLISFDLFMYALPAVALGFLVYFLAKPARVQSAGLALLGFGMAFYGMKIMTDLMAPLKAFPFFQDAINALDDYPVWSVIFGAVITAAAQSSGAVLGVALSLARQDLITLHAAIPIFFGASIGICFTAFTASWGAPVEAKRIAWAHLIYKICGVAVFLPLIGPLASLGTAVTQFLMHFFGNPQDDFAVRAIANTYTLFITITAFAALPFLSALERLTIMLIPDVPEKTNGELRTKYLDPKILDNPPVALGSARREISRMGRFVEEMMKHIITGLMQKDREALDFTRQRDNKVDYLNTEIMRFLTDLTNRIEDKTDMEAALELLYIVSDLESVGDIIDKNLVPLARKMIDNEHNFSEEGKEDLIKLHQQVSERLSLMVIALSTAEPQLAEPIITGFGPLQDEGKHLHLRHLQRMREGLRETIETSSVHLDVINYLLRIDFLTFDISLHLAGKAKWIPTDGLEAKKEIKHPVNDTV